MCGSKLTAIEPTDAPAAVIVPRTIHIREATLRTIRPHLVRRLAAGALVAATAGGMLAATGPAAAATPTCRSSQLVTWLDTNGNGAAGTVFYALNFTNIGSTCTLRGFPGVSAVSQNGHQLGSAAAREKNVKVKPITLKGTAGGNASNASSAQATLGIVEAGNFPASACHQTTASGLRVYAPNQNAATFVPYPFAACSRSGPAYLKVTAVKR
jgi:hypothetical protein